jgi:hypothetical protein
MAISFVAAGAVATGSSPTVPVPAGYQQGDLLVIALAANALPSTPTGWTLIANQTTTPAIYVFRKFATGSETSVLVTSSSTATSAVMLAYRGVSATDTVSTGTTATSTTIATGTLTTSYANEYVVSIYGMTTGAATWTAPASTTSRVNSAGTASVDGLLVVDELQAAAGVSTARTATSSVSKALSAISFSIIPSGRYWVGGSGTWDTTTTTNWSFSSGGSSGAPVPTAQDNVTFDSATTYTVTCTGALKCQDFTVSAGTVTFATGTTPTFAISGSMSLAVATVVSALANAITFNSALTTNIITTNGLNIAGATFTGGGKWTLGSAYTTAGNTLNLTSGTFDTAGYALTVSTLSSSNTNTRSFILNNSTVTINANITFTTSTNLTFNAGTSQINLTSTPATFAGGGQTFYNVTSTANSVGTTTITGTNTFNNLTINNTTAAGVKPVVFGANQTISGTFTLAAGTDATMRTFAQSDTLGTVRTLTCAAVSFTDADFQDITIAGAAAPVSGTRLGDCKGNSGITFGAGVTKYWNLAAGGNWGGSVGWATTGGGTPAINNLPLAQDTCVFQSTGLNSAATITVNANYNIGTIDMSARTSNTMTLAWGTTTPTIYGDWKNGTGTTLSGSSALTFSGRTTQQITSAGKTFPSQININSPGGSFVLQDAFSMSRSSGALTLNGGTFNANSQNCSFSGTGQQIAAASGTTVLAFGTNSTWTFSGGNPTITFAGATVTTTGTGTFTFNGSGAKVFAGGSNNLSGLTLNQGSAAALTITGSNTLANITNTYASTGAASILFTNGTTTTVAAFTAVGTAGKLLSLNTNTAGGTTAVIAYTGGGNVSLDYLSVQDMSFTPFTTDGTAPYKWFAGANSTNLGNNKGLLFATTATVAYLLLSGSSWTVPADWKNSNNSIHLIGGGGGGAGSYISGNTKAAGGGGGGGGYTRLTNQTLTPSASIAYSVGAGGSAGAVAGNGGAGTTTSWNSGAATAGGGSGGTVSTTPGSGGGAGGTGTTANGGAGAAGAFGTTATTAYGGGGGGGAGGPNGNGGAGGAGFSGTTVALASSGGGGGNGGGSAGSAGTSGVAGTGGNNFGGTGGGVSADGTNGGGGAGTVNGTGGAQAGTGFVSGIGTDILNTTGGAGGSGGGTSSASGGNARAGGIGGSFGGGAGGTGTGLTGVSTAGAAGGPGMVFIVYVPGGGVTSTGNFFLMF